MPRGNNLIGRLMAMMAGLALLLGLGAAPAQAVVPNDIAAGAMTLGCDVKLTTVSFQDATTPPITYTHEAGGVTTELVSFTLEPGQRMEFQYTSVTNLVETYTILIAGEFAASTRTMGYCEPTPVFVEAPLVNDPCGTVNDSFTVPVNTMVRYFDASGATLTQGSTVSTGGALTVTYGVEPAFQPFAPYYIGNVPDNPLNFTDVKCRGKGRGKGPNK